MNITANKISGGCTRIDNKSSQHYGLVKLAEKLKSRKTTKILQASSAFTYLQNSTAKNISIVKNV